MIWNVGPATAPGAEFKGTLLGKRILVTPDRGTTTVDELRSHLSRFNLAWLLRRIGELNAMLDGKTGADVEGVPVPAYCLPYLAFVGIEASSDENPLIPTAADLAKAARIFSCQRDQGFTSDASDSRVFEYMIRMGYSQFAGRGDLRNLIARTWMIYGRIWSQVRQTAKLNVAEAIREETGLTLRQLMMFGLAYSARSSPGYFVPYSSEDLTKLPSELDVALAEQEKFLKWVTATYDEIRQLGNVAVPDPTYDKYRLSPFLMKPVVRPDRSPAHGAEQIRIVPVPRYLARRVTDGLYHALATAMHQARGANPFRVGFGHAFQEYVGELLRLGAGTSRVMPEREYGPKKARRRTPDWMVIDGDRLVVVEVKQSALTLNTKMLGRLDLLAADLEKTLTDGTRQLLTFRDDLRAEVRGLEDLRGISKLELLLVTHDDIPWGNWVIRDAIAKNVRDAHDVQLCSIDDFENLQRYCWGNSPFDLLEAKRLGPDNATMHDFREWLFSLGEPATPNHPVLAQAFSELASTWGAIR
jgi:hypothetical protein